MYSVAYTDVIQIAFIFGGLWLAIPFMLTSQETDLSNLSLEDWSGTGKRYFYKYLPHCTKPHLKA